jgi:hypothetical protein
MKCCNDKTLCSEYYFCKKLEKIITRNLNSLKNYIPFTFFQRNHESISCNNLNRKS